MNWRTNCRQSIDRVYASGKLPNLFSHAPLGLAFMGKRVGDTVTYTAGPEERRWEILQVGPGV